MYKCTNCGKTISIPSHNAICQDCQFATSKRKDSDRYGVGFYATRNEKKLQQEKEKRMKELSNKYKSTYTPTYQYCPVCHTKELEHQPYCSNCSYSFHNKQAQFCPNCKGMRKNRYCSCGYSFVHNKEIRLTIEIISVNRKNTYGVKPLDPLYVNKVRKYASSSYETVVSLKNRTYLTTLEKSTNSYKNILNGYVIEVEKDKVVIGISDVPSDYLIPEIKKLFDERNKAKEQKKMEESIKHQKLIVQRSNLDKIGIRHTYCWSCPQHRSLSTLTHLICNRCNWLVCDCSACGCSK
ncbi:hypothetical protein [Paucisalibacillus sp. EB02]|uniref:hypothetical protein n=1 Tax=Paucisalibacillus sp. EB02 TaxID=1347087 RepID=UPI0004B034B2|nr:hypothetical protein [Paucisalibacillus sp. EB02]